MCSGILYFCIICSRALGVNESQIYLGWDTVIKRQSIEKETIMNNYLDKSVIQNLSKKYGKNKILDSNSFGQIFKYEKKVMAHLNENTTSWK